MKLRTKPERRAGVLIRLAVAELFARAASLAYLLFGCVLRDDFVEDGFLAGEFSEHATETLYVLARRA